MTDLAKSTDAELTQLQQDITAEQKRRKDIAALQQDAQVAAEQIQTAAQSLESYGAGNRFEILRALLPDEFIDWVVFGGGVARPLWVRPTSPKSMYMVGDTVTYQGAVYKSLVDHNSFSPLEAPNSWQSI